MSEIIELKNTFKDWNITQKFGWTDYARKLKKENKNWYRYGIHTGLDFGMRKGTKILVPHDGLIVMVDLTDNSGRGKALSIWDTKQNIATRYYHLNSIYVRLDEYVTAGQPIAEVGNTGLSTASHLHFELVRTTKDGYATGRYNGAINPLDKKLVNWVEIH